MNSCLFCSIVGGSIPCTEVYNDENILAFRDIDPKAPTHILVIPKGHIGSLNDITAENAPDMAGLLLAATEIARREGLADQGYRFVINCGEEGGQTVGHLHLHILGGRQLNWPPG